MCKLRGRAAGSCRKGKIIIMDYIFMNQLSETFSFYFKMIPEVPVHREHTPGTAGREDFNRSLLLQSG